MTTTTKQTALERVLQVLAAALAWPRGPKQTTTNPAAPQAAPRHSDDAEFCYQARHGAFPLRRKFIARGTSATGHQFMVFQCPAPACAEFVATTIDDATGQDRVLFRGRRYAARREPRTASAFRPSRDGARPLVYAS